MAAQLENGARFNFIRTTNRYELIDNATISYRVTIELPTSEAYESQCELTAEEKHPVWREPADVLPLEPWMLKTRDALARQIQRSGARGDWPRKLRQWKSGPTT